ncbi:MAG: MFS transporter, partial [Elusimicrobia bacterium]|nr:MFS transporter [Elusimicrobiota bacterium]
MNTKQPRGFYFLFFAKLFERFGHFGMRAILMLYIMREFLQPVAQSGMIYSNFMGFVYVTPLIGGFFADKYLGARKSLIWGAAALGLGIFAISVKAMFMLYAGLFLAALGTGFFSPNFYVALGRLYPDGDARRDSGFILIQMAIGLGAFMAPFICGTLGEKIGWTYGFFTAGAVALLGAAAAYFAKVENIGNVSEVTQES